MPAIRAASSVLAASVLLLAAPASGSVFVEGDFFVLGVDTDTTYSEQTPFAGTFSPTVPYDFAVATPLATASSALSVWARGDLGWLQVVTVASSAVGAPAGEDQVRVAGTLYEVRAGFQDTITIDAPGLTGQPGSARLGMDVAGLLSADADWFPDHSNASVYGDAAFWFQAPSLAASFQSRVEENVSTPSGANPGELVDRFLGGTAQFVFGTPFPIEFSVGFAGGTNAGTETEDGRTGATAAATMVSDFRNTFTWAGLSELRDAHGDLVPVFAVTSLSGTDYRGAIVPVPEPGTALPVLAALAALARRRRR